MKRNILIIVFLLILSNLSFSQVENYDKPRLIDKLVFGGNFGLLIGNVTHIDISPKVGYKLSDRSVVGIGAIYQYYKDNREYYYLNQAYQMDYETNIYGGRVYGQYILIKETGKFLPIDLGSILVHAEYEFINVDFVNIYGINIIEKERQWIYSPLFGFGINQKIGKRSSVSLLLLWNLNEQAYSPYSNPVFRIGINF